MDRLTMAADAGRSESRLPQRLRELRAESGLTQIELATRLRPPKPPTNSLISSWESDAGTAVPSETWLQAYARVFGHDDEATLRDELLGLRRQALGETRGADTEQAPPPAAFWRFGDTQRICLIGSELPLKARDRAVLPTADPRNPDWMPLLTHGDGAALLELFGHLRRENPDSVVHYRLPGEVTADDLAGHVVVLGGEVGNRYARWFRQRMDADGTSVLPRSEPGPGALEDRHFVLPSPRSGGAGQHVRPTFERTSGDDPFANLLYDVALIARTPNPVHTLATATLCAGLYAKGTYGAVRTLTHAAVAPANEAYLQQRFGGAEAFWLLFRVLVDGAIITSPDLTRDYLRLREWPSDTPTEPMA